jgi:glycosyltransferase involved in cell wall biosynthesis
MILSIVIPCYNERATIHKLIDAVRASPVQDKEIIIVDDCSTDGTREILQKEIAPLVGKIIYHERNQGKGAALRTGFAAATGEAVIVQDADLEYDPQDYEKLMQPIIDGKADAVYGVRFGKDELKRFIFMHYVGNKFLTFASNIFSGVWLKDMETCYKMIRRDVLQKITIEENRFGFEPEITAKLVRLKARIVELPIYYRGRTENKKISAWRDGFPALWAIVKYNVLKK